eukprot:g7335.t1
MIPEFVKSRDYRHPSRSVLSALSDIRLGQFFDKSRYPDCEWCWGCFHNITRLPQRRTAFGLENGFEVIRGDTAAQIYQIQDPALHGDEIFLVKLWGINNEHKSLSENQLDKFSRSVKLSLGIQQLVDECGLRDIVANVWLAPVDGVVPIFGVRVKWDGLWSEYASGVSVSSFEDDALANGMDPNLFQTLLNEKLNSSQIVNAAILDLLSCQGDRHTQNVFLNEDGQITLIDNDEAFGHGWRPLGVDSIFLPTTQYHTAIHVGQTYLRKKAKQPRDHILPSVVFDYRCHVENGTIGFNYPPMVKETIKRIANMSMDHVMDHYHLPDAETGSMLVQRARDLLEFGFEWTLEHGEPRNPPSLKYPWHPPCCKIRVIPNTIDVECMDPNYERNTFRPKGDALYGQH